MHNPAMLFPRLARLAGVAAVVSLAAGCGGATDDRPAKWSFISAAITEPSCATVNCHSEFTQRSGLDMHARDVGYYSLINGCYVIPSNVGDSPLMTWLNAGGTLRMPPDNPLPPADIDLIQKWIMAGAKND
jgi:hypothetical protein